MATKKTASKRGAKAPTKKSAAKKVRAASVRGTPDDPIVRALAIVFAAFSVLFAMMAAWRFGDW